ncbi:hypothetical protein SpAn4DRAFT_0759 [Sporomusa ovata]|uniref:Uncharacterized protein n=1 Tax=Sporomusa ovata TaxID=2378 RepID=A0A0U1L3L0_9FIRM|nr:hypothetical protein SpAn4DRAFT_0759 [Sporomusa ovata]
MRITCTMVALFVYSSPDLCPGYYFLFLAGIQLILENKV